ncbi:uncharacterized protein F5147DRAFT_658093 [Suillus discolor]|uniref:Uncharacterized protein n=1 Tax=Suillus discolor TaxID=1912936 RepID=A0A9P7EUZ8_9AGAM|nr:uncharacterized protein F5147DRAFT_658093 [Suillus discolor]KAG2090766.1 hypothetical protein F5147DRAFT_658093 [Suillus discolor]
MDDARSFIHIVLQSTTVTDPSSLDQDEKILAILEILHGLRMTVVDLMLYSTSGSKASMLCRLHELDHAVTVSKDVVFLAMKLLIASRAAQDKGGTELINKLKGGSHSSAQLLNYMMSITGTTRYRHLLKFKHHASPAKFLPEIDYIKHLGRSKDWLRL